MFRFFEVERNDQCPCESGKKYKCCCMEKVDEYLCRWRGRWEWVEPGLNEALALACGLSLRRDECLPAPESIERALSALGAMWAKGDEDEVVAGVVQRLETLARLLQTDPVLEGELFPLHKLRKVLDEINEIGEDVDLSEMESHFERIAETYLPRLVNRDVAEEMAWAFFELLRDWRWTDSELQSVVLGLHFCMDEEFTYNPLWETVLRVSIGAAAESLIEMEKLEEEGEINDRERLEDYLARHPIMEREWSRIFREKTGPAMEAILNKLIPLDTPPYAVMGSLLGIADYVRSLPEPGDEPKLYGSMFQAVMSRGEYLDDLMGIVLERGLDLDFDIFVDYVTARLEKWLDEKGRDAEEELKRSLHWVLDNLGDGIISAQREMLNFLYLKAVINMTDELPVRLPQAGLVPGVDLDWTNRESLTAYITYLQGVGNIEAAAHVKAVYNEFAGSGA